MSKKNKRKVSKKTKTISQLRIEEEEQELALNDLHWGVLILTGLSFLLLSGIIQDVSIKATYPSIYADAPKLMNLLIIGTLLYILPKFIGYLQLEPEKRRKSRESSMNEQFFVIPKIKLEISKPKLFTTTMIVIILILTVQIIAYVLEGISPQFNVSITTRVYEFFSISAVAEELVFRVGIAENIYKILKKFNISKLISNLISSAISAAAFGLIHENYYDRPYVLAAVIINGFIFAFALLQSKYELPSFIGHVVNNIMAAGQLVQEIGV